jgi:quercetin dioxygenase-like cupin family protein
MDNPNPLEAKARNLSNLISYQGGAVVSRTVIDKTVGTVTLFAFDQKQGLSEHTAPFDAMALILEGTAQVTIAGKPLTLKQGETTIMPANKPHALTAITPFKMLLIMIKA